MPATTSISTTSTSSVAALSSRPVPTRHDLAELEAARDHPEASAPQVERGGAGSTIFVSLGRLAGRLVDTRRDFEGFPP